MTDSPLAALQQALDNFDAPSIFGGGMRPTPREYEIRAFALAEAARAVRHYRDLRENEHQKFDQLVTAMLAYGAQIKRAAARPGPVAPPA